MLAESDPQITQITQMKGRNMVEDKYMRVAREIMDLFEREFGEFSVEDLDRVIDLVKGDSCLLKPCVGESGEDLSPELRDQIEFMMGL